MEILLQTRPNAYVQMPMRPVMRSMVMHLRAWDWAANRLGGVR